MWRQVPAPGERENSGKEETDGAAPRQAAVVWGWVPGRAGTGVQMRAEQVPSHMPDLAPVVGRMIVEQDVWMPKSRP